MMRRIARRLRAIWHRRTAPPAPYLTPAEERFLATREAEFEAMSDVELEEIARPVAVAMMAASEHRFSDPVISGCYHELANSYLSAVLWSMCPALTIV
jgi:hypothetical protein